VDRFLKSLNAIILLFMFLITIITVVNRIFLKMPTSWSVDLAQTSYIFLTFIGSAALMKDESHIKITVLVDRLSDGAQKIFRIIGRLLMIPFFVIFVIGAYKNVIFNWTVGHPTVEWMKIGYMYLVLFISGIIMIFYLCINIYNDLYGKKAHYLKPGGAL
jgi:TRAP-type transport system small permease protein